MDHIIFNNVVPHVFSSLTSNLSSEIWNTELSFDKEKLYLVEADSGKGKSTFCSYIQGYRHDYNGNIFFDSRSTKELSIQDWTLIRKQHISLLFQELRLFPELTSFENVQIKNQLTNFKSKSEIVTWFELLGIADKIDTPIKLMSFGQQQRVAMMRALVQPFDFILVDEPISHLDESNSQIMGALLLEESRRQGAGVIVTSIGKHMELSYDKILRL